MVAVPLPSSGPPRLMDRMLAPLPSIFVTVRPLMMGKPSPSRRVSGTDVAENSILCPLMDASGVMRNVTSPGKSFAAFESSDNEN